jgi:hypothetical protein
LLPVLVVAGVVLISVFTTQTKGTIVVEANVSGSGHQSLHVSASVGNQRGTTPFNVTVSQGVYKVTFSSVPWYRTPAPREVTLPGGGTMFAVGTYRPRSVVVAMTSSGFNSTRVTALHGVTPVVWVNLSGATVSLTGKGGVGIPIPNGGNFTIVFPNPGTYPYSDNLTTTTGMVSVD